MTGERAVLTARLSSADELRDKMRRLVLGLVLNAIQGLGKVLRWRLTCSTVHVHVSSQEEQRLVSTFLMFNGERLVLSGERGGGRSKGMLVHVAVQGLVLPGRGGRVDNAVV